MAKTFLLDPNGAAERLQKRFRNQWRNWLQRQGKWPLPLPLGLPGEPQAMEHLALVREWQNSWANWSGAGEVSWTERQWRILGTQRLPELVSFNTPDEVARFIGQEAVWAEAVRRFREVTAKWPVLEDVVAGSHGVLTEWDEADFQRLVLLLEWLVANPSSNLYPRQLPVPGLDSKWLENRRKTVLSWLRALRESYESGDLYALAGLKRPPEVLRIRLLDPELRKRFGGLGDIQAPVAELARLALPVRYVFVVENLQTGLAFEDLPGAVVFMGQGYSVEPFGELPWLKETHCFYWGDLDTHGLAILSRLRHYVPTTRSLLMDSETLLTHRNLWGHEAKPSPALGLQGLDPDEQFVFEGLKTNRWDVALRLEQERIPWDFVTRRIHQAISEHS